MLRGSPGDPGTWERQEGERREQTCCGCRCSDLVILPPELEMNGPLREEDSKLRGRGAGRIPGGRGMRAGVCAGRCVTRGDSRWCGWPVW